jgi:hypothetical protein
MYKIVLLIFITMIFGAESFGQTVFSNGSGGGAWNSGSTWQGGVVPGEASDVLIAGTDSVYTLVEVTCNSLTLLSGAKFATGLDPLVIAGLVEVESDAYFYNRAATPTLPGSEVLLDAGSYVVHSGSGTVGGATNSVYGNLIIQRNEGVSASADLLIMGDLIVNMAASNVVFRGARFPTTGSQTHTVLGDVYIYRGTFACIDVGENAMSCVWNIDGNVYVIDNEAPYLDARFGLFSSANATGLGIINIGGDLILDGGRLQGGTSSSAGLGTGIINLAGNLSLNNNSGISSTTHAGPFAINFVGSGTQTVTMRRNFSIAFPLHDTISAGSTVLFDLADSSWGSTAPTGSIVANGSLELMGNSKINGSSDFHLNPGGTLRMGSPEGISSAGETGNIQVSASRNFSSEANYVYSGTAPQNMGDGIPSAVSGLGVENPNGISLSKDITASGQVNVVNGDLNLNGFTLTLAGSGVLSETPGNTVTGASGKIAITRSLNSPTDVNVGGLGAVISSSADLGTTLVERYHSARIVDGNQSILRYYNISPANNTGLNASLRLHYDESELNGLNETGLSIFKSADASENSWTSFGGTTNTDDNFVEVTGINELSFWTIAGTVVSVEDVEGIPSEYKLSQNYPNPFNPETIIRFDVPRSSFVNISIYNLIGQKVATVVNNVLEAGYHQITFDASELSTGVYIYKLTSDNSSFSKKMIYLK